MTQEPGLFPHLTVGENITFGISKEAAATAEQKQWIETLRNRLQLGLVVECSSVFDFWRTGAARVRKAWDVCWRAGLHWLCLMSRSPAWIASSSAS